MIAQPEAYVRALIIERQLAADHARMRAQMRAIRRRRVAESRAGAIRRLLAGVR